jgi:hypothetical protein
MTSDAILDSLAARFAHEIVGTREAVARERVAFVAFDAVPLTTANVVRLSSIAAARAANLVALRVVAADGVLAVALAVAHGAGAIAGGTLAVRHTGNGRTGTERATRVARLALPVAAPVAAIAVDALVRHAIDCARAARPNVERSGAFIVEAATARAHSRFRAGLAVRLPRGAASIETIVGVDAVGVHRAKRGAIRARFVAEIR